jgi:hypothetical protein
MIHVDHVCLGVRNVYEGSVRLAAETGLGHYEGGFFKTYGLANRIFPTGSDTYIEVEGVIDVGEFERGNDVARYFHDATANGDVYIGWCARADSREELEALGRRLGTPIIEGGLRTRPNGFTGNAVRTPDTIYCWQAGLPNVFLVQDMAQHPARQPTFHGTRTAVALNYLELGGSADEMAAWLGQDVSAMPLRFNGGAHGVHAVSVKTDQGDVVIRRDVVNGTTGTLGNRGRSI